VFELPYGRGRKFGSTAPFTADALLGGWQLSGWLVLHTGPPLTATTPGNIANTEGITQVPNRICNPNLPTSKQKVNEFFNTSCFSMPAQYTLGNAGVNTLDGPGFRNVDLSLSKAFRVAEKRSLQFRGEFFNATNHPNNGAPGTTVGVPGFGEITSTLGNPRTIQVGLKFLY